uniref:Rho guanine nucleotide exchange factor 37 n=1 Tax=Tetraodon nigroviridis TaxID=99883 RepID=H3C6N8_TETNG
ALVLESEAALVCRPEVNATSLSFFLVMPVQRVARYPLLLQTLQKLTPEAHPASGLLRQAAHASVALNCRINEYKRLREVADKYKNPEQLSIKEKINRLSTHSIAKKTARISLQLKHEAGIRPKLVDEDFEALEGFFCALEQGVLQLLDNVQLFLLQRFLACRTEEFDLELEGEREAASVQEVGTALRQWLLPTLEDRTRTLVLGPLLVLRDLLRGPRNLIRKRLDKLLDYEQICEKASLSYEEQAVASTYRPSIALLLQELPRFHSLALQVLWTVVGAFSCLHRDLAADMEQLLLSSAQQVWRWAESAVLDAARRLDTLCLSVQDSLKAPVAQPLSPSSRRRLKQLTDKHGSGRIYQLTGTAVASRDLDLSLSRGELVAVLSEADTRGDGRRWLVDAGGRRGYAPSSKLTPYHQPAEAEASGASGLTQDLWQPAQEPVE